MSNFPNAQQSKLKVTNNYIHLCNLISTDQSIFKLNKATGTLQRTCLRMQHNTF